LGFGIAGAWLGVRGAGVEAGAYARVVGAAALLALAMLAVGFLISARVRTTGAATAVALFVWLALVVVGDLGLMGTAITMRLPVSTLLALTLVNPLEAYRVGAIAAITGSIDVLGPAGVYATRALGDQLVPILGGILIAWCLVPLVAAQLIFNRRGIQ
jgi:Cu-processing system permease protein